MEEKLEALLALLNANQATEVTAAAAISPPSHSTLQLLDDESFGFSNSAEVPLPQFHFDNVIAVQPSHIFSFPNLDGFNDIISKGFVSYDHAEASLEYFRMQSSSFPFVIAPKQWSLDFLRSHRPLLLLAIICMATRSDSKLQRQLEFQLREMLSRKVLVNGEKSLDVIQGILLYLGW
jgi:hypothetical protein